MSNKESIEMFFHTLSQYYCLQRWFYNVLSVCESCLTKTLHRSRRCRTQLFFKNDKGWEGGRDIMLSQAKTKKGAVKSHCCKENNYMCIAQNYTLFNTWNINMQNNKLQHTCKMHANIECKGTNKTYWS